ncbi:MAG: fructose-bisphosphatase [Deltaproteobacteria bacterium RIFCSPLOWO2_02_FULL_53_8]|nr:MAG: fructose-bisphosphatase [Deltaproteobacteria bacterium RIFCSPLOWO2_02_FULL_53_8]
MSIGMTLTMFLLEEQRRHLDSSGSFTALFSDLVVAAKLISREVNKAGLIDIIGATGETNIQGEEVQKLDELANATLIKAMERGGHLAGMASEEMDDVISIDGKYPKGGYLLLFDPLDGSSNIDVNVSVGTIFSILKCSPVCEGTVADFLQQGVKQVAAGYILYGSSTMFVYTTGHGVHGFTLDPSVGEFLLSHENIRTPERGSIYSINEGNTKHWVEGTAKYIERRKAQDKVSARYVGSLVCDFHRNLLKGGIFLYPGDKKSMNGKLRLLYEANPLSFIVEQAGGAASTGDKRILEIEPTKLHQRTPLIIGSKLDVEEACRYWRGDGE